MLQNHASSKIIHITKLATPQLLQNYANSNMICIATNVTKLCNFQDHLTRQQRYKTAYSKTISHITNLIKLCQFQYDLPQLL